MAQNKSVPFRYFELSMLSPEYLRNTILYDLNYSNFRRKMITKDTIKKIILENRSLLRQYKVLKLGLFGSYVRGDASESSDIDLLIETGRGLDLISVIDLELKLSKALDRKVDLVSVRGLNKHIKPYIMKEVEFVEGI